MYAVKMKLAPPEIIYETKFKNNLVSFVMILQ